MTRCQEANTKLEKMAIALDGANIDLQNVNNKFMALSNSQFVESRVYEDDVDVTAEDTPAKQDTIKAPSQPEPESDLAKLKQSLKILESMHESVRILDSDSDSDTDETDGRMVYKAIDLYADRPLPHIIGSQAWKSKWHAGIIPEDSDSDSSTSKPGNALLEQYSESESELTDTRTDRLHPPPRTISSSSSIAESEPSGPAAPVSQAHIAAELARKLGGNLPEELIIPPEPVLTKPMAAPTKIYNPATSAAVFFDEPPPLDQTYQSDGDSIEDEDDDIFAELHKNKASFGTNKDQSRLNEDLFGGLKNSQDVVEGIFGVEKRDTNVLNNNNNEQIVEQNKESEKKPIGGISLFGSSKGTENIGAAILKRTQRKTYSSDEESEREISRNNHEPPSEIKNETVEANHNSSKSIINKREKDKENVGSKSNEAVIERITAGTPKQDILKGILDKNKPSKSENNTNQDPNPKDNKIDLFSDNIFDDIDNIFTDNFVTVPIKETNKNTKSIFDDFDDNLFAEIAVTSRKETDSEKLVDKAKSLFDSDDDDLFLEPPNELSNNIQETPYVRQENIIESNVTTVTKKSKSIFDGDSDDEMFSKLKSSSNKDNNNLTVSKEVKEQSHSLDVEKVEKNSDNNNLFSDSAMKVNKTDTELEDKNITVTIEPQQIINKVNSKKSIMSSHHNQNVTLSPRFKSTNLSSEQSPALFDEEETDDLFNNKENKTQECDFYYSDVRYEREIVSYNTGENVNTLDVNLKQTPSLDAKNVTIYDNDIMIQDENNLNSVEVETAINELVNSAQPESVDTVVSLSINIDHLEKSHEPESQSDDKHGSSNDIFTIDMEKSPLPNPPNQIVTQGPEIFNDIFNDVPPAFEKPKEPKRSKNINALFDDDSDDESLFFKKDDAISEEKPELNTAAQDDSLFRIFSDEPPAIDVDFAQSTTKVQKSESEMDAKVDFMNSHLSFSQCGTNEIRKNIMRTNLLHKETEINKDVTDRVNNIENKTSVGKLKAINFNIDVNTLLPGASPKKSKPSDDNDGQVFSSPYIDSSLEHIATKLVKPVSFEGEADSELLNNKLSKERAKIQVKRRPSTRRARQEAVKKSGIDFDSKSTTDNSSALDDSKATVDGVLEDALKRTVITHGKEKDVKSKVVYILNDEDIFSNVNVDKPVQQTTETSTSNKIENLQHISNNDTLGYENHNNIFKNISVSKPESSCKVASIEHEVNFCDKNKLNEKESIVVNFDQQERKLDKENTNSYIKTENYNEKFNKTKASIFDDMSDEETELFHGKKPVTAKTKNMFGSDSDEELFATNSKKPAEKTEQTFKVACLKVETKKSLFDDDSDDDLFGGKPKSSGNNMFFSKPKDSKPTRSQSVVEDPLSLFTDDDE